MDSKRKQTEEHLKLFKKVVESATDAIGISTSEGRHWYQNPAFDALFGDIGEDPPATLYCDMNAGREVFETIMAGGEWSGEVQMYAADGRVLDILLRAYAFTDETGKILGLVGVHTDITDSKRWQELFKRVAQSTNDVFYEWNVQTDSLQWFSDISIELGYAPGEVPATINGWIELIHPDDRPQLANAVKEHRTFTHDINYLYRVKHKNGNWRYWSDHATPVLDNHNRPVRWVGGISDITEHKQVENAYKESEAQFHQIAKNIREVFWLFDLQEQQVLYVSPAYNQIWGRSRESLYQRYDDWVESIHPEDLKHAQETFNHILDTGGGEPREYRIVRPDGAERWISDTGYAVKDEDGKIVRVTGIAEDITERKKAEEALANKAALERIISEASRRFLTLTELDKSINACLADIGRFCGAGRTYLFQFTSDGNTMNNTHEWCAPGVKPEIEELQSLPLEMFPWWIKLLEAGENIHVKNVAELPPEAQAEKEILEVQNIKSVLVVPFLVENRLAGFLGFDNVAATRTWGEKELVPLRTLAEIIGTAVTRKRAEKVLQESEERYRLLADNSVDMISRHAADGTVLFVSPSCESVTGYTIRDLLEKPAEILVHPDDIEKVWSVISNSQASEDRYVVEHRLPRKDGSVIWVETMGRLFRDMSGNVIEIQCNVRDITERKRAEEALRESEERLRLQIERMPIALILWDHNFKVMTWNPAAESIFGYSSEEALGRHPYGMIVPQESQLIVDDVWGRLIEGDTTAHSVNENNTKDGSLIICSWTNTPLKNHEGSIIGVLSMVQDITEQTHAEEALRQSEAKFRELADMLPQIVFETDVKGNLTFVNHNAFNTFGYTKDDVASGLNATQMIAPKDRNRAADRMRQIMRGPGDLLGSEYRALKKDGTEFPVIIYSTKFLCEGSPAGLRGIMIDITDRMRAEEERKNLQAQLIQAQKMEAIGTLAGGIAHNFNNILMGVQGRTSLMIMGKDPSDPDYEHLKGIEEYVKNAVELTRDLLGYARGGKYEVKPTDLNTLIKHENRMFGRTKREIRVHEKYEKDLWTVEVDQSQIKQALLNLYVNAWQAMPGEGDLYIQTENATVDTEYIKPFDIAPGRYVKVSVTDTGAGMDAATRERIFDPFFSTKSLGQGSGLGLASVYGIIKNHGGFINVYSERGEGTTFNIYLPASEREAEEEGPRPERHEIQYGQGTVLLVDDEDMIVEVGQAMLEKLGYRAVTAGSGQGALDLYEKHREEIDLVILDMIMPDMGGGETYDRLREIDGDVKVILSSGYSIEGQAKEIMDRGCSGFIQKPFAMEELSRMVREALDEGKTDGHQ